MDELKNEITSLIRAYAPVHVRAGAGDDYAVMSITFKVQENLLARGSEYWDDSLISRSEILHEINLVRKEMEK